MEFRKTGMSLLIQFRHFEAHDSRARTAELQKGVLGGSSQDL